MGLTAKARQRIIDTFQEIAQLLKRKAKQPGTRLQVLADRLAKAFPGDRIFRMLDVVGDLLGRQTDALALKAGAHGSVRPPLVDLNRAGKAWLSAFYGPAQGTRFGQRVLKDIEATAADFVFESHHVVEVRVRKHYAKDLAAFVTKAGEPPDPDAMIAIAIPAGLHRGARYYPLELKSPRLRKLRESLESRPYNLTERLQVEFPDSKLATLPFPDYLSQLSEFYKKELPEFYREVVLPDGSTGGFRAALLQVAQKTGQPVGLIAANPP